MKKTIFFNTTEYNVEKLIYVRNQGIKLDTELIYCIFDNDTVTSDKINIPIVAKTLINGEDKLYVLIKPDHYQDKKNLQVSLLSKHILKKAAVELIRALSVLENTSKIQSEFRSFDDNRRIQVRPSQNSFHNNSDSQPRHSPQGGYRQDQRPFNNR